MIFKLDDITRKEPPKRDVEAEKELAEYIEQRIRDERHWDFSRHPDSKKVFWWMAQYIRYVRDKQPRPEKGLLIVGGPGTGKTRMAKIISGVCRIHYYTMNAIDLANGQNPEECRDTYEKVFDSQTPIIIDDVGAEAGTSHYGNRPILQGLMTELYEYWTRTGKLVIITTNLKTSTNEGDPNTIIAKMGARVESRFHEMFYKVLFNGKDLRQEGKW